MTSRIVSTETHDKEWSSFALRQAYFACIGRGLDKAAANIETGDGIIGELRALNARDRGVYESLVNRTNEIQARLFRCDEKLRTLRRTAARDLIAADRTKARAEVFRIMSEYGLLSLSMRKSVILDTRAR